MSTSVKPRLRGVSHEIGFFVALVGGAWLVATAGSALASGVTAIYVVTLALMLGVSASYHRGHRSALLERRWQRADHAMIFAFVAGTYTPICVLGVGGAPGMRMLALVWVGAALGALRALLWVRAPRVVAAALYVALGWLLVGFWPDVRSSLGTALLRLLIVGGVLYTVGAVIYAVRRPDPLPRWFGYHEVFHVLVIAACVCHFVVISQLAGTRP
jgi:hemolysin III